MASIGYQVVSVLGCLRGDVWDVKNRMTREDTRVVM